MNHIDPMISIALDRQAEQVHHVQACGASRTSGSAGQSWQMTEVTHSARPAARMVSALALAAVAVGLLVVYVAR